jgi:hypothetical protein
MRAFVRQLSPYARVLACHPLFILESARVRRLLDQRKLFRMSFTVVFLIFLIALFFWVLAADADYRKIYGYARAVDQLMTLLLLGSIGWDGFLDFACMVASANSFAGEIVAGRWELLRLTPFTSEDFAVVKHSAARLRVWRMTMVVFGLRLTVIILGIFTWLFNDGLAYFQFRLEEIFAYAMLVLVLGTYLVEPIWRAETVTVVGLMLSIRLRNSLSLTLGAIGSVLALWILQPVVMGGIFWLTGSIFNPFERLMYSSTSLFLSYFLLFLVCLYIAVVLYGFYAGVRKFAYGRLIRQIERSET